MSNAFRILSAQVLRGFLCIAALSSAIAQEEIPPVPTTQRFRLDPESGCYHYTGNAVEFVGRFRAGSYVGVTMQSLDASGLPLPADREERSPALDAPVYPTTAPGSWFGPLPESRDYGIMYSPRALWGGAAIVTICGRMSPPAG